MRRLSSSDHRTLEIIKMLKDTGHNLVIVGNRLWIAFLPLIILILVNTIRIKRKLLGEPEDGS